MSFFRRSDKTDTPNNAPRGATPDTLQQALLSIQSTLQQFQRQAPVSSPRAMHWSSAAVCAVGLAALAGAAIYATRRPRIPAGIYPIKGFHLDRYLGKWYEMARIEQRFEKGLQRCQTEYSRRPDGSIHVINRGYDPKHGEWQVSRGKAHPTIAPDIAAFKVSFLGPFYGGYNVVALDDDYQWAMVVGESLDSFWILSRTPTLPDGVQERLIHHAQQLGIPTQRMHWVHQDGVNPTGSY